MVEEEQEKHCELIVYKEEIDYYVNKNRELAKQVNQLNKDLLELQLTKGSTYNNNVRKTSPKSLTDTATTYTSPLRGNASMKSL